MNIDEKRAGEKKWSEQTRQGVIAGGDGTIVRKSRRIDRINDKYQEHVEALDGRVIVHKDEKLSEHRTTRSQEVTKS
ncbi:MAG: hypothetical protein WEB04_02705 [Dehalococcoidia bacterium]